MLTMLIRASAICKNHGGDPSILGYVEMQETTSLDTSRDADFASLDCLSHILVQDKQVLAASYDDAASFTLVMPSSVPGSGCALDDSDPDSFDMDFPPHEYVGSSVTCKPINATIIPNPDDRREIGQSSEPSGPLGEIREIEVGKSLWNKDDPLSNVLE